MKKIQTALCCSVTLIVTMAFAFRADDESAMKAARATTAAVKAAPQRMPTAEQIAAVKSLDGVKVDWDARTGAPASILGKDLSTKNLGGKGLSVSPKNNFAVNAIAVMDCLTKAYRLRDAAAELTPFKTDADELGFHHVRMNQIYQGLGVVGGQLIAHFNKSGQAYQVNGRYIPGIEVETKAVIDPNSAVEAAQRDLAQMGKPAGNLKGSAELVIYADNVDPVLAYGLTLVYHDAKAGAGNWRYWVNARDGTVVNRYNAICKVDQAISGKLNLGEGGDSVGVTGDLNGGFYWLRHDPSFSYEIYDYPNSRIARSDTASWPTTADGRSEISACYNFINILTYYSDAHARNSYDNSGAKVTANVHVSGGTDNAYWDPDTQQFYFYPGSRFSELTVLDVAAHEFTHALTEKTAGLVYQNEAGALNESFSDIFGAIIEFTYQPDGRSSYPDKIAGYSDWLLGEDCTISQTALRDMRDPRRYNNPSKYHGTNWYSGTNDNGGVHYNSGVQNHFFYLLCEGGSGTNDGVSYNITGIGVENAKKIAYRALTVYCTAFSDYAAARAAWISAATDLRYFSTVQAAWAAVGVSESTLSHSSSLRRQGLNNDFDSDDRGDYALYDYQDGNWFIWSSLSSDWLARGANFGDYNYLPVPGDYDGDGKTDVVVYSPATAGWMIYYTGTGVADVFQFGGEEYIPAPGDYDGDGKTDFALYNYVTGAWYIFGSSTRQFLANGDVFGGYGYIPVPGDYNGGGKSDVVVYSKNNARWYLYYPETGAAEYKDFGGSSLVPAPGDYDGDGVTDFGLYDYLYGFWYIWSAVNGWLTYGFQWGDSSYIPDRYYPVAGDYNSDGISDLAVYSSYYGDLAIYYAGDGSTARVTNFGGAYYVPITYWALYGHM